MDVISELMGVPEADRDRVRALADDVMHREDGVTDLPASAIDASINLIVYYQQMVAERRTKPTDDLTSALLDAEIDGDRLTDDEVLGFMFLMVIAGNETTTKLLANAAFWGHRNPDQLAPVYEDLFRVPLWVEETLRYDTSSQILARTVSGELTLYDTTIPKGDVMLLLPGSAHRDERVFENPDTYLIGREIGSKLLSFGSGAHFCLGAHLARMEARVALTELFRRIRGYEVDEANAVRVHSSSVRGFANLPITVKAALMPRFEPHPERRPTIVAGASSGIGAATAIELAQTRLSGGVGGAPRREAATTSSSRSAPTAARPWHCTSTLPTTTRSKEFVHRAVDELGDIELLVAGAGDTFFGRLHDISTDTFESQVQIHLIGANRLATAVLPGMLERQRGDLIFIGSDVALRQRPHMGAYGAAKAALIAMVTNLQMELEGTGVRASIVHPGPTKTGMGWSLPPESIGPMLEDWAKWGQARHDYFLRASDLARAVAFVAETPRGGFIVSMEVQPEAPLANAPKDRQQLKYPEGPK